jgi:uncharacterized membrane protein YkvA (DUF1232 family)
VTESGSSPARKAPARKTTAKKTTVKKATATKAPSSKATTKGTSARKTAAKKAPATKAATKKTATKKTAATKKTEAKKTEAKKTSSNKPSRLDAARELARSAPTSKFFARARARAQAMIDDPDTLKRVADESHRSGAARSGTFEGVMDDFRTLVRLVVAYARGNYREIPPDSLALVVAGLLYVVSPLDLLPDAVPVIGFRDDAEVVGWVIKSVRNELDAFRAWEVGQ